MYENLFRMDGQVALLPGGYGGIGSAMARGFAEFGADVVIAGRSAEKAQAAADELASTGRRVLAATVDVTDPESVERLVGQVMERFGRIDVLVNLPGKNAEAPAESFPL